MENDSDEVAIDDNVNDPDEAGHSLKPNAERYRQLNSATSYREYKRIEQAIIEGDRQQKQVQGEDVDNLKDSDFDRAATKIQAAYRGYSIRSKYNLNKKQSKQEMPPSLLMPLAVNEDKEAHRAAIKIQAAYRGHIVRSTTIPRPTKETPAGSKRGENPFLL